jgi:hypothetical protein
VSKKSRQHRTKLDPHLFEAPIDLVVDDDEIDFASIEDGLDDDEWWNDSAAEARLSTRRKIERRRERRALRSELDDWESFGDRRWD